MKTNRTIAGWLMLAALSTLNLQLSTAYAQGTAFSYQGRLNVNGSPATGIYDVRFAVCDALANGNVIAGPLTNSATAITNGLFCVTLDFGGGVFTGSNRWVEIAARTNGAASFTTLSPRQPILPVPYAVMANSASNLLGTLPTAQLSGTIPASQLSGTAGTATNFTGTLNGDVTGTQSATAVASVGGQSAANVASGASAANAATSAATANTIVKRDAGGSFTNNSISLNGNLNLPATTASVGIIYSGGSTFIHAYGNQNFFAGSSAGNLTMGGPGNTGVGLQALHNNTSGEGNAANGYYALANNTSGSYNTAIGLNALANNTNGSYNTANGYQALYSNTSGNNNTANGSDALFHNTSGYNNTADGSVALSANTNGNNNTALGDYALSSNASGSYNIAVGYTAGANIIGNYNIDIGNQGTASDTNIIRIGDVQTQTFIAGVINGDGGGLANLNAASLSGITSNQLAAATWQLATNLNGGKAALASNVVSGIAITNAFITNSVFAGNGGGLANLNASQLTSGTISAGATAGSRADEWRSRIRNAQW